MHVHSPIWQCQLIEKKIRSKTFIDWVKKTPKKGSEKGKKKLLGVLISIISITIFQGLFNNIVFRYLSLVSKKFFFQRPDFFRPVPNPKKIL